MRSAMRAVRIALRALAAALLLASTATSLSLRPLARAAKVLGKTKP